MKIHKPNWLIIGMLGFGLFALAAIPLLKKDNGAEERRQTSKPNKPVAKPPSTSPPEVRTAENRSATRTSIEARPVSVATEGYATSASCIECHPKEHSSWHASYHRTMTQIVDTNTAPEVIRSGSVTVAGLTYRFSQEGDKFYVTLRDPLAGGEMRRREILMMTGSHHMHVFWYESDAKGAPAHLDIVYLKDEKRWIHKLSSFLRPPNRPEQPLVGTWNHTCSKCHSTHPRERLNKQKTGFDTHVVEFGIACEACHGQGAEHVRRYKSEQKQDDSKDKIVNPATLSKQASADVCGRCHSIASPDYEVLSQEDYMQQGNPFETGTLLSENGFNCIIQATVGHRDTKEFKRWSEYEDVSGSFWVDGMARVTGREYNGLIESPCFQRGEMTCLSCHTMHPSDDQPLEAWRDDQLKPDMRGDHACLQCHETMTDRIAEHTHHDPKSSGSRCQNCHMPYTTYGLLKTIRSHQISSPSANVVTDRPNACSLCHLDKSFDWVGNQLHDWYKHPLPKASKKSNDQPATSLAVTHLLQGDAGQRAVQATAFGWPPAREASGTDWMEPYLLFGLNDPYDAIRIISARNLRSLPNRRSKDIDAFASPAERMKAFNQTIEDIDKNVRIAPNPEVLIKPSGQFDFPRARKMLGKRNHRIVDLRE